MYLKRYTYPKGLEIVVSSTDKDLVCQSLADWMLDNMANLTQKAYDAGGIEQTTSKIVC